MRLSIRPLSLLARAAMVLALSPLSHATGLIERPGWGALFERHGLHGTFVLYDVAAERTYVWNAGRARTRYTPASTYKIPNSLIALETGAVKDLDEVIPYGGGPTFLPQWAHDMALPEAIRVSNVPVYQQVARRIGHARMNFWVQRLGYGNQRIGHVIDQFWLQGPLAISALEQTRFLARLAQGHLPLSVRSQALVQQITVQESNPGYTLHAKTGWATDRQPHLGWWVGWVLRGGKVYSFALNVDLVNETDGAQRIPLGRALLQDAGVIPHPPAAYTALHRCTCGPQPRARAARRTPYNASTSNRPLHSSRVLALVSQPHSAAQPSYRAGKQAISVTIRPSSSRLSTAAASGSRPRRTRHAGVTRARPAAWLKAAPSIRT
ncbi:class D beta-lactamase [Chitiniphilus purpureus]|uniref:Class D beta-lactamase n=1 Tax=Chitiniphilus purpureus TaxID=2981137 RepID=A0ABY6DLH5_9NEIS|nr:class D beta-lactamase [Chitiniphilus sp. CD1]UXY15063.1 class D beta-lactamase [Chitiniphilus sp. CD1]